MSNLSSIFDVIRGWPNGCALSWSFKQKNGVTPDIAEGEIVAVEAESGRPVVARWTSAALTGGNPDHPWLVIRGKDQFDADFSGQLTVLKLRTGIIFKVATTESPATGDPVYANAGVLTKTNPGSAPPLGRVIDFNPIEGWMVVES